jgi:hypothetical protein
MKKTLLIISLVFYCFIRINSQPVITKLGVKTAASNYSVQNPVIDTITFKSAGSKMTVTGGNAYLDGYLIKSTNNVMQQSVRGSSENNTGSSYYSLYGVGINTKIRSNIQCNVISANICTGYPSDTIEVCIYSNSTIQIGVMPVYYNVDRWLGYPYTTASSCARCTETYITHTNGVHPSAQGYYQIADIIYSYLRYATYH